MNDLKIIYDIIYDNCEIRLFADDALIYVTEYSSQEINESLNKQMKKIEEWLNINSCN